MKAKKASREDTVLLNAEISRAIKERLDKFCRDQGMKIRAVVEKSLDEYLRSKGY